jgi:hypothetical protein
MIAPLISGSRTIWLKMPRKTGFFDILHSYLRKKPPSQCEKCLILPWILAQPLFRSLL